MAAVLDAEFLSAAEVKTLTGASGARSRSFKHPDIAAVPLHFSMLLVHDDGAHVSPCPVAMAGSVGIRCRQGAESLDRDAGKLLDAAVMNMAAEPVAVLCLAPVFGSVAGHDA